MYIAGVKGWLVGVMILVGFSWIAMISGAILADIIEKWIKDKKEDGWRKEDDVRTDQETY